MAERMIQVPASLIEHVKAANEALSNADRSTWVRELQTTLHDLSRAKVFEAQRELNAAAALLSQPTPIAEPSRIEDMAPGTTFTACFAHGGSRALFMRTVYTLTRWDGGTFEWMSVDRSTIRDVTPPLE